MTERLVRFPAASWDEIEALPEHHRRIVQTTIFQLLDDPVPALAQPFPVDEPLQGADELHLPADGITIWYTLSTDREHTVVSIQHVRVETRFHVV